MPQILERLPEYRELTADQRRAVRRRLWRLVFSWAWVRESLLTKLVILGPAAAGLVLLKLAEPWLLDLAGPAGNWAVLGLKVVIGALVAWLAWVWLTRRSLPVWRAVIAQQAWGGRARFCLRCGYDLRHTDTGHCVECGASRQVDASGSGC